MYVLRVHCILSVLSVRFLYVLYVCPNARSKRLMERGCKCNYVQICKATCIEFILKCKCNFIFIPMNPLFQIGLGNKTYLWKSTKIRQVIYGKLDSLWTDHCLKNWYKHMKIVTMGQSVSNSNIMQTFCQTSWKLIFKILDFFLS